MKSTNGTNAGLHHEMQLLRSAESMLVEAIPLMIEMAKNKALKMSLAYHLAETRQHKVAMEFICKQLGIETGTDMNTELNGIIEEGKQAMNGNTTGESLDAAIISGASKVEHYEISAYEKAARNAENSGEITVAAKLRSILEEERQADGKLSFLAKNMKNIKNQKAVTA